MPDAMAFCPRCGAPTTPGQGFCGSCGEKLAAGIVAPAPYAPPHPGQAQGQAHAQGTGRVGEVREPLLVILLAIVTLGLYGLYYWWVVSREVDEHTQRPGHSHNLVRIGTIVSIVSALVLVFAFISFMGSMISSGLVDGDEPTEEEIMALLLGGIGIFVLGGLGAFVGSILRLIGKWRMWSALEEAERRRMHANPISAGLMLALSILGWFVPFVGWILPLVVMWMTQEHLNQAWRGGAPTITRPSF